MKQRLLALDVLRGITIAGMILVNTPGSWQYVWTPLEHSEWNGLTPTDLVFPSFMFMMGMAMYISLRKFNFQLSTPLIKKIIRRTLVIFLIGTCINVFANCMYAISYGDGNWGANIIEALGKTRTLGVLQRLALCYGIGSFIIVTIQHKKIPIIVSILLLGYFIIQMLGNGFVYGPENVVSIVDRAIIGTQHMYNDNQIDPEGILSTIPSIAHVLIGFYFGKVCIETKDMSLRLNKIFIGGSLLLFAGFLLQYGCPINKKVWSPTFVLTTCGILALLMGILLWLIDANGEKKRYTLLGCARRKSSLLLCAEQYSYHSCRHTTNGWQQYPPAHIYKPVNFDWGQLLLIMPLCHLDGNGNLDYWRHFVS